MRKIGRDGRVWRLTKEVWDLLLPFDSDPNLAILKMQEHIEKGTVTLDPAAVDHLLKMNNLSTVDPKSSIGSCKFDEKTLKSIVKESMDAALEPFIGK